MTTSNQEQNKPSVTHTTHIGNVTGAVHTGAGDINIHSFNASGSEAISTKDEFLAALQKFLAELEAARQQGMPEDTVDDATIEIKAVEQEAKKEKPRLNRMTERLENAKAFLIAGTGVATTAATATTAISHLIPLLENALQVAGKVFS